MNKIVDLPLEGNTNPALSAAQAYGLNGWRVFPVDAATKRPMMKSWQIEATTDLNQIAAWWAARPDLGIGIATGRATGLVVLDFDVTKGKDGLKDMEKLEAVYGPLPETLTQSTPSGGTQRLFRYPAGAEDVPNRIGFGYAVAGHQSRALCGIDVRGDSGQVNVSPTSRAAGAYHWHSDPLTTQVAELPARWVTALNEAAKPERPKPSPFDDPEAEPRSKPKGKAESVMAGCAAIERLQTDPKGVTEWGWKMGAGVVGRCERGRAIFHRLSKLDPARYSEAATNDALDYMLAKDGPHGCAAFSREMPDTCTGCLFHGRIAGPAQLGLEDVKLLGLLRQYVYTTDVAKFYGATNRLVKSKDDFSQIYAHINISSYKQNKEGDWELKVDGRTKQTVFTQSRFAAKADTGAYTPGETQRIYRNRLGQSVANTWLDDGISAEPGDYSIWKEHVDWLIPNDEGQRDLWLDAIAFSLQRPNVKLRIALLLISYAHQLGKGALIETWGKMLGDTNYVKITNAELRSDFQGGMHNKQLAFLEELFVRDGDIYNDTKALITEPQLRAQLKFENFAPARPPLVIVAASNKAVPIRITEPKDVRWHVTLIEKERRDAAYYQRLQAEGPRQIAAWKAELLRRPLGHFDPAAPAPMTRAKAALVSDSRSAFDRALDDVLGGRQVVIKENLRMDILRQNIRGSASDSDVTDGLRQRGWKARGQHKLGLGHGDAKGSFWTLGDEWEGASAQTMRDAIHLQGGPREE